MLTFLLKDSIFTIKEYNPLFIGLGNSIIPYKGEFGVFRIPVSSISFSPAPTIIVTPLPIALSSLAHID